jgi:hypothetical protein
MAETHNRKFKLGNSSGHPVTIIIEPWPHEFELESGCEVDIVGHWSDERFDPHIELCAGNIVQVLTWAREWTFIRKVNSSWNPKRLSIP